MEDITFALAQINANDETCIVKMSLVDMDQEITEKVFQGKHENFLLRMEYDDVKFCINLKTGVMRKIR